MNLNTLTIEEKEHIHKKLKELATHDGWNIVKQFMRSDIETFYRKLSKPEAKPDISDVHYNRGIIESVYLLMELPDKLIGVLENDLFVAKSMAAAKAPPAPLTTP